jgi:hypothetical protein
MDVIGQRMIGTQRNRREVLAPSFVYYYNRQPIPLPLFLEPLALSLDGPISNLVQYHSFQF